MRRSISFLFPLILLCFCVPSWGQLWSGIVAPSRATDWSQVGTPGGIPTDWTQCGSTIAAGASASTLNAAINACTANHYVQLGAGTFNLNTGLLWAAKSNVALKGMGANSTFLVFTNDDSCYGQSAVICFRSGDVNYSAGPSNVANWTGGYARGTTSIILSSTSNLSVGDPLTLDQTNDTSDNGGIYVCSNGSCVPSGQGDGGAPRGGRSQQQIVTVTSISGNTVGITPALRAPNWTASKSPQAWWPSSPISRSGIENLSIQVPTNQYASITFFNCNGCWMRGIRSVGNPTTGDNSRSHVILYQSNRISVVDNYFYKTDDTASVNYGVEAFPAADSLIQNNIFEQVQAPIPLNGTCNGCVLAYNFDVNNVFTGGTWMNHGQFLHATDVDFVLSEGNIGAGFDADDFHGTHNIHTVFRNYYNGYQKNEGNFTTGNTTPIILNASSRFVNIVGNVLGNPTRHSSYSNLYDIGDGLDTVPSDPNTGATLMRWGNFLNCSGSSPCQTTEFDSSKVPSNLSGAQAQLSNSVPGSTNLPASFYLPAKPSWWGTMSWPGVGPDVTGGDFKYCTGGSANGTYVRTTAQCSGGTATTLAGGRVYANPAAKCYLDTMAGPPDGTGPVRSFDAASCYGAGSGGGNPNPNPTVNPPSGLSAIVN